jgi:cellobiose phosphorylase
MYTLILESLLGLKREGDKLRFVPCLRADWETFKVHYRYRETLYHISVRHITVLQPGDSSVASVIVDGLEQPDKVITLIDDRKEHSVEVRISTQR